MHSRKEHQLLTLGKQQCKTTCPQVRSLTALSQNILKKTIKAFLTGHVELGGADGAPEGRNSLRESTSLSTSMVSFLH